MLLASKYCVGLILQVNIILNFIIIVARINNLKVIVYINIFSYLVELPCDDGFKGLYEAHQVSEYKFDFSYGGDPK